MKKYAIELAEEEIIVLVLALKYMEIDKEYNVRRNVLVKRLMELEL